MRIAAPPTAHSCFYGIDTPELGELLASRMDVPAMAEHIGVNSLAFVSMDGLYRAMGEPGRNAESPQFCDACFTGDYPTQLTDRDGDDEATQLSLLAELA
jgi:amidophosphoribosyltransferase